jgi:cytochrome c peroxidase
MSAADQDAINRVFANLGKAIAAFERRIVSRRSPFDRFAEGLRDGDPEKLRALSPPAQRGLRTFVGRGNCRLCHSGPNFTDGEFHSVGVPERASYVDYARLRGIHEVVRDPFNGIGPYSDDRSAGPVRFLPRETHQGHNQFKTPTLRNVAETAPYMHNGSFPTLEAVVRFYSTREGARFSRHHTESILRPLDLTGREVADLVAFLESLTGEPLDPALTRPPSLYHSRDSLAGHPHGAIAGGGRFVIMPWPALPPA